MSDTIHCASVDAVCDPVYAAEGNCTQGLLSKGMQRPGFLEVFRALIGTPRVVQQTASAENVASFAGGSEVAFCWKSIVDLDGHLGRAGRMLHGSLGSARDARRTCRIV